MLVATHQHITREWWKNHHLAFELFISPFVIEEISQGNAMQSAKRLAVLKETTTLTFNNEVVELAGSPYKSMEVLKINGLSKAKGWHHRAG